MSDEVPTINPQDVARAFEAFRDKWHDNAANAGSLELTLAELGFADYMGLRLVCKAEAYEWAAQMKLGTASIDDLVSSLAAAITTAVGAGTMLGRFHTGEVPES